MHRQAGLGQPVQERSLAHQRTQIGWSRDQKCGRLQWISLLALITNLPAPTIHRCRKSLFAATLAMLLATVFAWHRAAAQPSTLPQSPNANGVSAEPEGPVRLKQVSTGTSSATEEANSTRARATSTAAAEPYLPGEFERFVQRLAGPGAPIRRLGSELITGEFDGRSGELSPLVPADYLLAPGDEILLTLWGSVDADLRLVVDRAGRISIPRVGTVQVAGVRYADLQAVIEKRVAQVFRNFQLSAALGQLRGIRVFVTGYAHKPGTYTMGSLSTVVAALMRAGGPSPAGSFRQVELRRGGALVSSFDLYDLLLKGDRSADPIVQAGDVVHVGSVGTQVGVIGSLNRPAVVELKPGESVADALRMAGGFSAVADRSQVMVERLKDRPTQRVTQLVLPRDEKETLAHGDVVRALSATDAMLSIQLQNKRIRVEGEVARPGDYVLSPTSTLADALQAAGGLTPGAYIYGTQFSRERVRLTQVENYERALRDLETDLARTAAARRVSNAEDAAAQAARSSANTRLIEQLRALQPNGRVVLQLTTQSQQLPALLLEDGDRLQVPATPTSVGVFGSVFNAGSYLFLQSRTLGDYLRLAGGPTKGADEESVFVVRANGQVISTRQGSTWFKRDTLSELPAEPGDTVFVPEEMDKTTFVQAAKDWTQILYQLGIGLAGIMGALK